MISYSNKVLLRRKKWFLIPRQNTGGIFSNANADSQQTTKLNKQQIQQRRCANPFYTLCGFYQSEANLTCFFFFQDPIFSKVITLSENLPLKRCCVINDNSQSGSNIQMMVIQYWITNRRELDFKTSWSWPCNIGLKMIYFFDTGTRGRGLGSRQGSYVSDREKTGWLSRKVRHQFPAFVHWNLPPCPKERFPKPEGGGVPAPDGRKDKDAVTC